jgi:hypothetical protein
MAQILLADFNWVIWNSIQLAELEALSFFPMPAVFTTFLLGIENGLPMKGKNLITSIHVRRIGQVKPSLFQCRI